MNQQSNEYWSKRANSRMAFYHKNSNKTVNAINQAYDKAIEDINKEINKIFETYYSDGMISPTEARKILNTPISKKELDALKMKLEFIEDEKVRREILNRINAPAYTARINRLEAIKESINIECKKVAEAEIKASTLQHIDTIDNAYHRHLFDLQKGLGVGFDISPMPTSTIEEILKNPWSGEQFSSRVWSNTDVLAGKIQEIVTSGMMSGRSTKQMSTELQETMMSGKMAANRLIRTETTYMANASEMESYKEAEIEKYRFVATLDLRTSKLCKEHDGDVFEVDKAIPGENMPPLHPWCRSTTIAFFDEEDLEDIQRRARDPVTGKSYLVPANMKYEDWFQEHVINKYGESNAEVMKKKITNKAADKKQHEKYKAILGDEVPKSFEKFQELKYNDSERWRTSNGDYRKINAYNKIILNEPQITNDLKDIAKSKGTELVGLEYRLKSKESYLRKINTDSKNSLDTVVISETISNTNDVIRYTFQSSHDNLVDKYFEINNSLIEKGYSQVKVKNFWLNKFSGYKGVNCIYQHSNGQKFEIQYHTPESFELKNGELHMIYEEHRLDSTTSERRAELDKKMFELSSRLTEPKSINKIQ